MKYGRRIISAFLLCVLLAGIAGSLVSCSSNQSTVVTGEWLAMVVDKFGIIGYNSEEPYISSIGADNEYFDVVQAAYEWGIINGEMDLDLEDSLTKGMAANTLVNAAGIDDVSGMDYDEIAQFAVDNGYVEFKKYRGHTDNKRYVTAEEAKASLEKAYDKWANRDFGTPVESVSFGEDVMILGAQADNSAGYDDGGVSLPGSSGASSDSGYVSDIPGGSGGSGGSSADSGDSGIDIPGGNADTDIPSAGNNGNSGNKESTTVKQNGSGTGASSGSSSSSYTDMSDILNSASVDSNWLSDDAVAVSEDIVKNLEPGDTYIMPGKNGEEAKTYKVEEITFEGGKAIIHNSGEGASFEETVEFLDASGSYTPDLAQATITDGSGKVISAASPSYQSNFKTPSVGFADYNGESLKTNSTGKVSLDFKVDGIKIKGTVSPNSVSFSASGDIVTDKTKGTKVSVSKSYEIKDIKLDYDYKVEWFKLKYAYAKLDYTTVDKSSLEFSYKKTGLFAPSYSNGNGKFPSNFSRAILKDSEAKGAKTIKICSIPLVSVAGNAISFNLDVKLKISVSGKIELVVTTNNTKGIELKNGSVRFIKDETKDVDLTAQAKAEFTLYLGVSFRAVGFNIVGMGIEGGIGVSVTATVHIADSEKHLLDEFSLSDGNGQVLDEVENELNGISYTHDELGQINILCETCLDIKTYGILKFTIDSDCVIADLIKISLSHDFINAKNGSIKSLCFHFEDGSRVSQCTRNFKDIEESTDESTTGEDSSGDSGVIKRSNRLDIDSYFTSIDIGETYKITIVELPEGYSESDVVYVSESPEIATVDGSGNVRGVSGGTTMIVLKTSDGKHTANCSINVISEAVSFTPIEPVSV